MMAKKRISNNHKQIKKENKFILPDGDSYDESCGTIFLSLQGLLIFHCLHCPARYGQLQQYRIHLQLKHYCGKNLREWQSNNDKPDVVYEQVSTIKTEQLETTEAETIDPFVDVDMLPEEYMEEGQDNDEKQEEYNHYDRLLVPYNTQEEIFSDFPSVDSTFKAKDQNYFQLFEQNSTKNTAEVDGSDMDNTDECSTKESESDAQNAAEPNSATKKCENSKQVPGAFKCDKCDEIFLTAKKLNSHLNKQHSVPKHKCHICGWGFRDKSNCNQHIRRIHNAEKTFACTECPKQFFSTSELKIHQRSHTGEKPFMCPNCGKNFTGSSAMIKHIRYVHNKERTGKCPQCGKILRDRDALREHLHVHDKTLLKHACDRCDLKFRNMYKLVQHKKRHENKREYKCNYCDADYNQKASLVWHIKAKHGSVG